MTDLRFALRQLRRRPGFALATVLVLALGIGATTVVFTMVNGVLYRPLPVAAPERLFSFAEIREDGQPRYSFSLPEYLAYREEAGSVMALAAHHLSDITLSFSQETVVGLGMLVSGNYFEVLGIGPAAGRFFGEEEARAPGAAAVVVVSHELWQNRFQGDASAIGGTLRVNGHPLTIVGVAPRGFHGTMLGARPAVWLPLGLEERIAPGRDLHAWGRSSFLLPFGRPAPGVSREAAEAALAVSARRLAATHEYARGLSPAGARLRPFTGLPPGTQDDVSGFLRLLLATAGLVLLIAGVNVAGMFLAQATARQREFAIRLAVGGGRSRVSRQLVAECVVLALLGGAGSVLVASWTGSVLSTFHLPGAGVFALDLGLDRRVLAFAATVSFVTGILCGLVPALQVTGRGLSDQLRGGVGGARRSRLRDGMVVTQIALSMVLLIAAGLFARTIRSALQTEHGFEPAGVIAFELNLRMSGRDEFRGPAFQAVLLDRLAGLPGVSSAALASLIPLGFGWDQTRVRVPGYDPPPGEAGFAVGFSRVTPDYFRTLRMPLLAGRGFNEEDREGPPVIVINETFARRFWPPGSAVGQIVQFGGEETRVIGVVPDGKYRSFSEPPTLFAYTPWSHGYSPDTWLHVRASGEAAAVIAAVRRELRNVDPDVAPIVAAPMESLLGGSLFPQRIAAVLIGVFGVLGLILSAVGVFGTLSFHVVQRTREIGVRVALGATRRRVLRAVLRYGLHLLVIGVAIGTLAAVAATRLLVGLLHGVKPTDPLTFAAVVALLAITVVLAAWLPARRAVRIDPMEALRHE